MSYIFFCKNCGKRHEGTDTSYYYGKFCNLGCQKSYDWKLKNPKPKHNEEVTDGAKVLGWIVVAAIIGVIAFVGYDFYDFTHSTSNYRR